MLEWLLVNDEVSQLDRMNHLGLLCKVKAGQSGRLGHLTCPADRRNCKGEPKCVAPKCEALRKCVNEHKCMDETKCRMGYWEELEIFRCADGCERLAREMSSDIQKRLHGTVRTGMAVTDIHIADAGVLIGTKKAGADGKVAPGLPAFSFYDYVVLTAPPTVWDRIQVTAGTIDKDKTKPVGGKALGLAADPTLVMNSDPAIKFFTVATNRFWKNEVPSAAPSGGSPALGQVWEGTDNQTRTGPGQDWVLSVFAGPIIPDSAKPGSFRAPNESECIAELKTLYKTYPVKPKAKLLKNWPIEPFIRIGYANPGLGQVTTVGRKLTEVYHGRLLFAGEHTSMAFFGYMEGALRSGERAAAVIDHMVCPVVSSEARVA
jgi:monoamine oxidase